MALTSNQAKEQDRQHLEHKLPWPVRRAVRRDALLAVWRAEPQLDFAGDSSLTMSERELYFVERNSAIAAAKLDLAKKTAATVERLLVLRSKLRHLADQAKEAADRHDRHPAADQRRNSNETHTPEAVVAARRRREHAASVAKLAAKRSEAQAAYTRAHDEAIRLAAQLRTDRDNYLHRVDDLCRHAIQKRKLFDKVLCQGRRESTLLDGRLDKSVPPLPEGAREFELPDLSFLDELDSATDSSGGEREHS